MTSELKRRDIWEVANQLGGYVGPDTEERLAAFLMREGGEAAKLAKRIVELEKELNTRATPSVDTLAGLDRYNKVYDYEVGSDRMMRSANGEYVRYSEAAAVIAELKRRNREIELEHTGVRNSYYDERRKVVALKSELAQIKAQEPVDQTAEIERLRGLLKRSHAALELDRSGNHQVIKEEISRALGDESERPSKN